MAEGEASPGEYPRLQSCAKVVEASSCGARAECRAEGEAGSGRRTRLQGW